MTSIRPRGEGAGGMVRIRDVHDVLHERAAITRVPVPAVSQQVTPLESLLEVVLVEHRQPVPHAVHALKPDPALSLILTEWSAESIHFSGRDPILLAEPRLDDAVVTT